MKAKGADLSDAQVSQVVEYLVRTAGTLAVAASDAKGKGKGKGGGKGAPKGGGGPAFKNVQVINQATLPETMQSFVQALGLLDKGACAYCHVQDRSSDEKLQKVNVHKPDHNQGDSRRATPAVTSRGRTRNQKFGLFNGARNSRCARAGVKALNPTVFRSGQVGITRDTSGQPREYWAAERPESRHAGRDHSGQKLMHEALLLP